MATPDTQERLVIVEDEPVILQLLTSIFDEDAFDVIGCPTGEAGRQALEAGADVLLTDKNLPDIGGLELIRLARDRDPEVEAIVITGYASLETALQAMELGVFDYLVKPPRDIYDVRRKVLQAFERRRMVRQNRELLQALQTKNEELQCSLDELKKTQQELVQSEKLAGIGTLAAGVAHEIRSPLFGILGLAQAMIDEDDLGIVRGYAEEIVTYSRSIRDIVTDLTSYARTSDDTHLASIDLSEVLTDSVRLVKRSTQARSEVQVELGEGPFAVRAQANELQQILVNLIKNALDASEGAGGEKVRVALSQATSFVVLEVRDDGPGVPLDKRSRIFDPFYTTKAPGEGTGLGLNIVYRLVTKYRGTIYVDEAPEGGACFTVRLPVA
ncbi:MAG: response regulator [Deltaproteobacteria bacterium]|nr:MAG: response regulator [Deltaproteobacteria bacterium]